jgi:hypothetical protein
VARRTALLAPDNHFVETAVWGGLTFERVAELRPEADADGKPREFMPQARYSKACTLSLHRYGHGPFCRFGIPWSWTAAGVYVLTANGRVLYVGECQNLAQRFNMGYGSIQPRNCFVGDCRRTAASTRFTPPTGSVANTTPGP